MMELERSFIYGPIQTRRFGWDLGINLLPIDRKLCTFDCTYCQFGHTPKLENANQFPTSAQIISEWEKYLYSSIAKSLRISHTTICGNGEPTMHPHFSQVVEELVDWRDRNARHIKLAILSNGYRIHDERIRHALELVDEPILKFDAALPEKLREINRPLHPFNLLQYLQDLKKMSHLIIQTMFVKNWNNTPENLRAWRSALFLLRPLEVQIYTISRDTAVPDLQPLSAKELFKIANETMRFIRLPVHAFV